MPELPPSQLELARRHRLPSNFSQVIRRSLAELVAGCCRNEAAEPLPESFEELLRSRNVTHLNRFVAFAVTDLSAESLLLLIAIRTLPVTRGEVARRALANRMLQAFDARGDLAPNLNGDNARRLREALRSPLEPGLVAALRPVEENLLQTIRDPYQRFKRQPVALRTAASGRG